MHTVGKLFGGVDKVKIMRLFLLNPEGQFTTKDVALRSRVAVPAAARELQGLKSIGLVGAKTKAGVKTWHLDLAFPYLGPLKAMLKNDLIGQRKELARSFAGCGKVVLLIISGIFLENADSRADLLVVGTGLKKGSIDRVIKSLEAEIGKELSYAVFDTPDFHYRLNASDKFIRDILDYPHDVVVDKIGLNRLSTEPKALAY